MKAAQDGQTGLAVRETFQGKFTLGGLSSSHVTSGSLSNCNCFMPSLAATYCFMLIWPTRAISLDEIEILHTNVCWVIFGVAFRNDSHAIENIFAINYAHFMVTAVCCVQNEVSWEKIVDYLILPSLHSVHTPGLLYMNN